MKRRNFLKTALGGGLVLATGANSASASTQEKLPPKAVGILYDSNLCIGCQACMSACKEANDMPAEFIGDQRIWDNPTGLSSKTLNIIKMHKEGNEINYVKKQCMHCNEPACVNACPVSAMQKDKQTGIVTYDKNACLGCRYCQIACPYNVPKFEWEDPFPRLYKCQLCDHLLKKGDYSACCSACPTGASLFGPVKKLKKEAKRRLQMTPGKTYKFPVNHIEKKQTVTHEAKQYVQHIYGAEELGGSQCMLLAGTDFQNLGFPDLRDKSYVSDLHGISKGLYKYMLYPVAALAGLIYLAKRREDHEE